jgi:trypsin-like peptidase
MARSRQPRKKRPHAPPPDDPAWQVGPWQLHLAVLSVVVRDDDVSTLPVVYGTAFPIGGGLFVTASHVIADVEADGFPALSMLVPGEPLRAYRVNATARYSAFDLGLLRSESPRLRDLPSMPIDFDRTLGMMLDASAVGFPLAMDPEHLTVTPRAFSGRVVARRRMTQLPGQPMGYEVSFYAPRGLSGAPLVSTGYGVPRCYGYMVQQSTIGIGEDVTPIGIAVAINTLLMVDFEGVAIASMFGRERVAPLPPRPPPHPGGIPALEVDPLQGWPDDDPSDQQ